MANEDMWDENKKKKFVKRSRFDVTSKWCKCMHKIKWKWGTMHWDVVAIQTNKATNLIEENKLISQILLLFKQKEKRKKSKLW